jgi:DNA repair protein RecO
MTDPAIVTSVIAYGEADVVARLFTRDRGRVGAFARGARKSRKRYPGLAAPARGDARLKERHGADLLTLEELDVDPGVLALGGDLRALGHASYLCELVERMLPEHEPQPEVFAIVDCAIDRIAKLGASALLLRAVELKLLLHAGYLPDLADGAVLDLADDARRAAQSLVDAELDALPALDDAMLRSVARIFAAHLRRQGGPALKSVRFLAHLA